MARSVARTIQAPWVGSSGSLRSSLMLALAPAPPASEKDTKAKDSGSSFNTVRPREAVARRW
eukprot:4054336-Pyramimonas_sp.AAC.1